MAEFVTPTIEDIGRRVVYDPRPLLPQARGVIVGYDGRYPWVKFDGHDAPLCVISNLRWAYDAYRAVGSATLS